MKNAEVIFLSGEGGDKSLKVVLKGELTIKNTDEIREQVLAKIKDFYIVEIQTEEVNTIDLTFYQFLISMKKLFQKTGKKVSIYLIIPESCEELLKNAGLDINLN